MKRPSAKATQYTKRRKSAGDGIGQLPVDGANGPPRRPSLPSKLRPVSGGDGGDDFDPFAPTASAAGNGIGGGARVSGSLDALGGLAPAAGEEGGSLRRAAISCSGAPSVDSWVTSRGRAPTQCRRRRRRRRRPESRGAARARPRQSRAPPRPPPAAAVARVRRCVRRRPPTWR